VAALVASGLPTDSFLYLGYLKRKSSERKRQLAEARPFPYTLIFLETPHRLLAALADLQAELGDRQIAVARELTKLHEEIFRGSISAAVVHFDAHPPKGEITLVVGGAPQETGQWSLEQVQESLKAGLAHGEAPSSLAREVAAQSGWKRRKVYRLLTDMERT
jgi:16S rRNA (cytidine1402-2'-O)-methyltransferase